MLESLEKLTELREEDLMPNEKILMSMFQSWYIELQSFIMMGILILIAIVFFILAILVPNPAIGPIKFSRLVFVGFGIFIIIAVLLMALGTIYRHYSRRYYITNNRVLARSGIFTKHIDGVPYSKIQNIELRKSFYESIADVGDILIDVAGGPGLELTLDNVPDPEKPYKLILKQMKIREDRGITGI
ncbi:MAG: hypothetical protein DRO90_00685 [Candidatus Altiarchaeales archaeon]|nr:MAG: hypothetical protein DRO95_02565 [Candidatus Altiarchaeales archaeon]RLI95225.1 MAG: hypothetical protein DRO94_01005 [Candidatus Altiarchaeales archaeon]RLI95259.1 MAG: hypothetical protein DRO90_00685 [Candidatus Altiarchaeales archaeon]HDO82647.1 PH domain-containing protein [Candidatus Altiarchaeales archaeon]HEX55296.1 PH domain-containing protein [Candidatus Altiarchaeales archaeon]